MTTVALLLAGAAVSWAAPTVTPPPDAPSWWNTECQYYAYAWWEADLSPGNMDVRPPNDDDHWASNFLSNTDFVAGVVQAPRPGGIEVYMSLKNVYRTDLYKEIYICFEGTNGTATPRENGIYTYPTGTAFTGSMTGSNTDGNWTYVVSGEIRPQPSSVYLTFYVPGLTSVTDIWAGENCIPEPATMSLLTLGGLGLFRRHRR